MHRLESDSFKVLSIWDYQQEFNFSEEDSLPGFVLSIDMQRYPDFYIYNIIIPVSTHMHSSQVGRFSLL